MILGILQARMSSSRLPGKVLKPILGQPMLVQQLTRLQRSQRMQQLVIATSSEPFDDAIANLCQNFGFDCFRGDLNNVLDRFYQLAKLHNPEHIVRLTGDCPLCDPNLIDQIIAYHISGSFDYTSNTVEPTYPDGLDVEIFRFDCLEEAWQEATLPSQLEHVTPFIHQQPQRFKIGSYTNLIDLSHLRWTVDEPLDFELVEQIYQALYPQNQEFSTQDILTFLEANPRLKTVNTCYQRNEGLQKSLLNDELFLKNSIQE